MLIRSREKWVGSPLIRVRLKGIFWELVPDERYVANPIKGSNHNRGAAVDLTLITKEGEELEMPTGFDDFTEKAFRNCTDLSESAIKNRALLEEVMSKHGFVGNNMRIFL